MFVPRSRGDALAASLRPLARIVQLAVDLLEIAHETLSARGVALAADRPGPPALLQVLELAQQGVPARGERADVVTSGLAARHAEPHTKADHCGSKRQCHVAWDWTVNREVRQVD